MRICRGFCMLLVVMGALLLPQNVSVGDIGKNLLPCFPGAQGFGSTTAAGRGGHVIKVVNLDDSGPGSLRAALSATGPRIVVFEVGGTIFLKNILRISNPFITVAGQTAPSPGITLYGAGLQVASHDVLIRHLRIRVGDLAGGAKPGNRDALQLIGAEAWNVVADHLSVSWAVDENIGIWGGGHDITVSNCIISEGLFHSIHPKGPHSMGMLIGDRIGNVAVLNNLFAHNNARNPRVKGGASAAIVNNLVYNAGRRFVAIGSGAGPNFISLVGNRMIAGPDTAPDARSVSILDDVAEGSRIYLHDNRVSWMGYHLKPIIVAYPPVWHASLTPYNSRMVEPRVLLEAGARPGDRDSVDLRIVQEVRQRNGRIVDSPQNLDDRPFKGRSHRVFKVPDDFAQDKDGDGYSNIEEILHHMAAQVESR